MTHELKRVIGLPAGIASAVGLVVAASTLVIQGQGFGMGGAGFLIAMVIAMLINLFVMFSFAELSGIVPRAGSVNHYTQAALGPFMAIVAVLASYFIVNIFAGSAEASVPGLIFHDVFWDGMPPRRWWAVTARSGCPSPASWRQSPPSTPCWRHSPVCSTAWRRRGRRRPSWYASTNTQCPIGPPTSSRS